MLHPEEGEAIFYRGSFSPWCLFYANKVSKLFNSDWMRWVALRPLVKKGETRNELIIVDSGGVTAGVLGVGSEEFSLTFSGIHST